MSAWSKVSGANNVASEATTGAVAESNNPEPIVPSIAVVEASPAKVVANKTRNESETKPAAEPPKEKEMEAKGFKAVLPHVTMICILGLYVAMGSLIFKAIEQDNEQLQIREKIQKLRQLFQVIVNDTHEQCTAGVTEAKFNETMNGFLTLWSNMHINDTVMINPMEIFSDKEIFDTRWTHPTSILYALGVLTTTGYSWVQVSTPMGQVFAVAYGLIGFPIMFLTAADIGKLLSELVNFFHKQYMLRFKEYQPAEGNDEHQTLQLPAYAIYGLTSTFCLMCSLAYTYLNPAWSFVDALYFAFNAVTNVTLGDVPVRQYTFAITTVFFVVFGLAVVTMSIDLAQSELRTLFRNIHYFGRKIRDWREKMRMAAKDDEVKEVLRVIREIRKRHPQKENITSQDILSYLQTTDTMLAKSILIKKDAFTPASINAIKFADEYDPSMQNLELLGSMTTIDSL